LAVNYAWWVTVRIEPQGTKYDAIPVEALSLPLKALTLLSCEGSAATFTSEQCLEVRTNGARFEVVGDFNGDQETDIARVGVAKLKNGDLVRVLLIGPKDKPKQHQILSLPENGFSALFARGNLRWFQCMECDHGARVVWSAEKKKYVLEWPDFGKWPSNSRLVRTPGTTRHVS
jgi:hypothetical protein